MKIIERIISLLLLILLLPLFLLLFILVKSTSKGPFFYSQKRMGKNRTVFSILKIRTMKLGAEKLKQGLDKFNEADGPVFKIKDDPRYTRVGKFLSHSGLDELPQLINVLKGEMSLVGPRPLPVEEALKVPARYNGRFKALPGMTSTWVIKGNHKLSFRKWMELDLQDVNQKSLVYNLNILIATIALVLRNTFRQINRK